MAEPACILIPAHNRRAVTLACLAALRPAIVGGTWRIIVVDDGSTDGTGDAIRAEFPEVTLLRGDGQLHWTGAIARAMREVPRGATVFWLNDDCRPRPGALATLRDFLTHEPRAIAGPRCVEAASGAAVPTGFVGRETFFAAAGERRAVQGLSGFCVGIGAEAAAALGEPDAENFPHYAGDTAYTLRASRAGHPVVIVGDAVVELLDFGAGPPPIEARVRTGATLAEDWGRIFRATNSPCRLGTMRALLRLKYGPLAGTAIAVVRTVAWAVRFAVARTRH